MKAYCLPDDAPDIAFVLLAYKYLLAGASSAWLAGLKSRDAKPSNAEIVFYDKGSSGHNRGRYANANFSKRTA